MRHLFTRSLTSIFLVLIVYISLINSKVLFLVLILINLFALFEFYNFFRIIFGKKNYYKFLSTLISVIYMAIFSLFVWTYLIPFNIFNNISLIFLLIVCTSTDIGGFVFGKLIGGKKLTKISPNKTYSGVIGSFIFSLVFGYVFYNIFGNLLKYEINIIFLIVAISLVSQIGDLSISYLKRKAKVKDSGAILPGHGGILDRIDGILLAIPFGFILVSI